MFTGLVQVIGSLVRVETIGDERRVRVDLGDLPGDRSIGESIALSGVCCTVVELCGREAAFHLSGETLRRTWFGQAAVGTNLNLEAALRAGQPLGGHLVQGHVDGVGWCTAAIDAEAGGEFGVRVPDALRKYCVEKGSITVDGVSLTIAGLVGDEVRIAVIPHTAQVTTLGRQRVGQPVHVEVDVIAKYVESMLSQRGLMA